MEHARVVIIDDNKRIREATKNLLEAFEHTVVAEAEDRQGAVDFLNGIPKEAIEQGDPGFDVILLDGNLGDDEDCMDARSIFSRIRTLGLDAAVIGFSGYDLLAEGIPVDADTGKDPAKVLEAISAL